MKMNVSYFTNIEFEQEKDKNWEIDEEEMAVSLARALKALRKYRGYSLKTVSEATGIPFPTIARYESGENIPGVIQAYKLAYFYEFPLGDIFAIGLFNTDDLEEIISKWK